MFAVIISFIGALLKDKKHIGQYVMCALLTILIVGGCWEVYGKPIIAEIKATQLSQYDLILEKLDKMDTKIDRIEQRQWEHR
jgi:hypothetical protein